MIARVYIENNIAWFISINDAYLYKMNLDNGYIEQVIPLLETANMEFAFYDILNYEDCFVFVPCRFDKVLILDRKDWSKIYVEIPQTDWRIGETSFNFFTGIININSLYLFGFSYPGILKMDLRTKKFENFNHWANDEKLVGQRKDGCFHVNYFQQNNLVYFPFENINALMIFDLVSENTTIQNMGNDESGYISIEYDGEDFWLIPRDVNVNRIVSWNPDTKKTRYYDQYPEDFEVYPYAFYQTVNIDEKLLLFAHAGRSNISIDMHSGKMELFEDLYDVPEKGSKYPIVELRDGKILLILHDRLIWWDYYLGKKKEILYKLDEKIINRIVNKRIKNSFERARNNISYENSCDYNLESYIRYLQIR